VTESPSIRRTRAFLTGAALSLLLIALLTACAAALRLNAPSAGFLLLVGVLLIASRQSLAVATFAALAGTLSYNFFFFPPTRTLRVEDPENWIALAAFLLTSLLANRLLVRERVQAESARTSREDVEALYDMSVALLKGGGGIEQIGEAATRYLKRIGIASGGVIRFGASPQHQQVLAWTGAPLSDEVEDIAAGVARHGQITDIPSRFGRDLCLPLMVAGRVRAALIARGAIHTTSALESAANLLSFAVERERFLHERAHVDALRETNELKTSLLQAVSHDLKSPLTVLSVESEALDRIGTSDARAAAHVRMIRDEVARLHRRINNLLSVARFEAGIVSPHTEPTPPADLFRAARESLPTITTARTIHTTVDDDTPDVLVDPSLALEIVTNLIENAHRASPPDAALDLSAVRSPEGTDRVWIEVRDRGAGFAPDQAKQLRTIDSPDATSRGLGIELARTLAVLSAGSVEWFERPGGGTIARLDLPAAHAPVEEPA
jgi:two-component system sensor histidine kinase KdpD